jgi:hypothetical protein
MDATESRRRWPRLTLTLPPDAAENLTQLARRNYRDRRREALRLLLAGIERETASAEATTSKSGTGTR